MVRGNVLPNASHDRVMPHLTPIRPTRRKPRCSLGQDFFAKAEPLALVGVVVLEAAATGVAVGWTAATGFDEDAAEEEAEEVAVAVAVAGAADVAGFAAAAGLTTGLDGAEAAAVNNPAM